MSSSFKQVHLDPHIVSDIGKFMIGSDLILTIPISYYLSSEEYPNGIKGVSFDKYEACGVTAINVSNNTLLWSVVLVSFPSIFENRVFQPIRHPREQLCSVLLLLSIWKVWVK